MRMQAKRFGFIKLNRLIVVVSLLALPIATARRTKAEQTSEPARAPILRIETGMPTSPITDIDVDAENRYLVTAAEDKTVRVWELATAKLLKVLRPPIGEGKEGMLFAVAISPDGETIATGGETGLAWEGSGCAYLFNRSSGGLIRRITGVEISRHYPIRDLAYSKDGRFLIIATRDAIRVYETRSYTLLTKMDDCYLAEFGANNKFVTVSHKGFIRLYEVGTEGFTLRLSKEINIPVNSKGFLSALAVSFSSDGSKLAVGINSRAITADIPSVQVLSTRDLSLLYSPPKSSGRESEYMVAWSPDGMTLLAGTIFKPPSNFAIRKWGEEGRGTYQELSTGQDRPSKILPLKDGSVIYLSSSRPAFAAVDANGRRILFVGPTTLTYQNSESGKYRGARILLSHDGSAIQYYFRDDSLQDRDPRSSGLSAGRFYINDRKLIAGADDTGSLTPPITQAPEGELNAKLKQDRRIDAFITSGRLAISPDMQSYVTCDSLHVWLHDKNGKILWTVSPPADPLAVNITRNGKLVVVALEDGTIRWYRLADGQELLALSPHIDQRRWVLWTPTGYYDAAPGAEDLIGWHVNNGRDKQADFFPIGKFRESFYRPDVVRRVLLEGDERLALRSADEEGGRSEAASPTVAQQLPPVVEIISPSDGQGIDVSQVTVRFRVRSPSGEPITAVKALLNGRPASSSSEDNGDLREMIVAVPKQDVILSIIAENRFTASVPSTVRLKWTGSAARARVVDAGKNDVADSIKPVLYVLAIGVGKYQSGSIQGLKFPAKDARDLAAALERQKGGLYRDVVVKPLTDETATRDAILDGLDWIGKETTARDVAVVFLAGHGDNDRYGNYFFLPHNTDPERVKATTVPYSQIKETVETLAGKVLFFVDTCHSANVIGTSARRGSEIDMNRIVNELSSAENGAIVFTASTGKQFSLEDVVWNNGAFTKALVEGLSGSAAIGESKRITIAMLDLYISERVKNLTKGSQTPVTLKPDTVPDFPVAVVR